MIIQQTVLDKFATQNMWYLPFSFCSDYFWNWNLTNHYSRCICSKELGKYSWHKNGVELLIKPGSKNWVWVAATEWKES